MNSCELVALVSTLSCGIAKCVPKEELPLLIAILSQITATLATIVEQENRLNPKSDNPILPPTPADSADAILTPTSVQDLTA